MDKLQTVFNAISSFVWGPPLLILLVGTGIYFTFRLRFIQITGLPKAFMYMFKKTDNAEGDISSFAALCTALSATIGTGNIAGVATAIVLGGPGALFWMWVAAFFGMATKYAEGLLAIKFRTIDGNGQMAGGPMYYLENGLGSKFLAKMFAFFGIGVAFFGIGTFAQVNAISDVMLVTFKSPKLLTAIILTILVALVILGGIKRISKVAEKIVPSMAIFFVLSSIVIILYNISSLPAVLSIVITSAFTKTAGMGGFAGATVMLAMRSGIARGVFSNESGLGSAPIAAAAAKTDSCVKQGLISMTGTFIDSIIICTMTGLVLIMSGLWSGGLEGARLTTAAFNSLLPVAGLGKYVVTIGLVFFAFTTILGWNYYGERCTVYLFGVKAILPYKIIYLILVAIGGFLNLSLIWTLADIVNGLMAVPNLIGLLGLSPIIFNETKLFFDNLKKDNMDVKEIA